MDFYKIIFVHGFSQNLDHFKFLTNYLSSAGFYVETLSLPLTFSDFSTCEKILEKKIQEINNDSQTPSEVILIGFGLGGVLIKKLLNEKNFKNLFIKVVLMSTPTKIPKIIEKFSFIFKILSLIFKPLRIIRDRDTLALSLPLDIQCGIIRGTCSHNKVFTPFLNEFNDGLFEKEETFLQGENIEILDLPFGRYELLSRVGTGEYISDFIKKGRFIS